MEVKHPIDIASLRALFPVLHQKVHGRPLVYLDNAATTQKPESVIRSITDYYTRYNANIHRGAHHLANIATEAFEETRKAVADFIGTADTGEIIFTSGTTDSINLVAQTWGRKFLNAGDTIAVSVMEHHSNIVPWQILAEEKGLHLRIIPITAQGEWDWEKIEGEALINEEVKLVAVNHVSNALGSINDVQRMIDLAHQSGARVLIDGAQAVSHFRVDVKSLDCDFYAFSGHKLYGPTGTGILYGKRELLEAMPPYRGGGEMIKSVSFEKTTYNDLPYKFEAGTPHIAGFIALGEAIRFVQQLDQEEMMQHEENILQAATSELKKIEGLRIFGQAQKKIGVISFQVDGLHPYDIGTLLDQQGVAVRTGQHCTEPLWNYFGVSGSVRASFAVYTNMEDVQIFAAALNKAIQILR